ncbi:MAG: hypothetical protein RMJ51_05635 [Candidatus Calescibacterium sp.]|nr:hypothetical protein [Candidatus Calescibacterium sp.]MCX7972408.1 hypothetical protein [bacterium]MDW8195701.1 hypothetical protein [Candidatus Calescibacterium sp.]
MSVLSLGAILLIGGVLATTTALLVAGTGTLLIVSSQNERDKYRSLFDDINSNITDQYKQREILLEKINDFSKVVRDLKVDKKLDYQRESILNRTDRLSRSVESGNFDPYEIQSQINQIIKDYNELVINNNILKSQKRELFDRIQKISESIQEGKNRVYEIQKKLEDLSVEELQSTLDSLEEEYVRNSISILRGISSKEIILQRLNMILESIKNIDSEYYQEIIPKYRDLEKLDETYLKILLDQANLDLYQIKIKTIRTEIYFNQLKQYASFIKGFIDFIQNDREFKITTYYPSLLKLLQKVEDLLASKYIDKEQFENLQDEFSSLMNASQKYLEYRYIRQSLKEKLKDTLDKLGYQLIDHSIIEQLTKGEVIYLDLPYSQDYKVQVKLTEDNQIYFRLVKFVDHLSQSEYEKQRDMEIAKQWCKDYDKILEMLKSYGIIIENFQRVEPEEAEIVYILREEKKKERVQEKYMQLE